MASRRERRLTSRKERDDHVAQQRAQFARRQRNKRIINYTLLGLLVIGLAYGAWSMLPRTGEHDDLARCLSENGAIMYGTDWCPHCQDQKQRFGRSFKYVTYVNCDLNKDACTLAGVTGFPTWVFANGERLSGEQELDILARLAGCTDGP